MPKRSEGPPLMGDTTMMVSLKMLNCTPMPSKFVQWFVGFFQFVAEKYTEPVQILQHSQWPIPQIGHTLSSTIVR